LSENAVSQCKGKENEKGGRHFHDTWSISPLYCIDVKIPLIDTVCAVSTVCWWLYRFCPARLCPLV
jgi:hypothetical protein